MRERTVSSTKLHKFDACDPLLAAKMEATRGRLSFSFSLLVFLLFSLLHLSLSATTRCNKDDYNALLEIKKSLNNPYHLASWVPNTDCCHWYVVHCNDTTNRIDQLTVFQANISGEIPEAVGDLPYLVLLQFHHITNLTGQIPSAISKLKNLQELRLSYTNLSGPVPNFLGQLQNLNLIELSYNDLTGSIPSNIADLKNLNALHLESNRLTGSIPESFCRFAGTVPDLYLSKNQLSGTIPASLGNLDFSVIDLQRNKLEGDASMLFKDPNRSTVRIYLSRNLLEFDLSGAKFPLKLTALDLSHNRIYGSIPSQITELTDLRQFNVTYNRLCGQIPVGGKMQGFDIYSYFHNKCLCGAPLNVTCKSTL